MEETVSERELGERERQREKEREGEGQREKKRDGEIVIEGDSE